MAKAKGKTVAKGAVNPAVARLEAAAIEANAAAATHVPGVKGTGLQVKAAEAEKAVKKLTKRSTTQLTQVLVKTDKVNKNRAEHVKAAWEAVVKALPATAETLCKLEPLQVKQCVSPQGFVSYMLRRGYLAVKQDA